MILTKVLLFAASLFGFSALILDAVGAHALRESITSSWQTAVRSQIIHALFLIGLALLSNKVESSCRIASALSIIFGILLFSGSIYIKTLTAFESATRFAPVGGVLLMLGWLFLGLGALLKNSHVP